MVRGVETEESLCRTDRSEVLLEPHAPTETIRVKQAAKVYPPPAYAIAATNSLVVSELADLGTRNRLTGINSLVGTIQNGHQGQAPAVEERNTSADSYWIPAAYSTD